jgi:hypothetical protein
MKKIFQTLFTAVILTFVTNSCNTIEYSEEDNTLGFGPIKCEICTGPCTCANRFKTDDDYSIHEEKDQP